MSASDTSSTPEAGKDRFPDHVIVGLCTFLKLKQPRQRHHLAQSLHQLTVDLHLIYTAKTIRRPADLRNRLERIMSACDRAIERGDPNVLRGALPDFDDREDHAASLILFQAALEADPKRQQDALCDGRARAILEAALNDPMKVRDLASAALGSVRRVVAPNRGGAHREPDPVLREAVVRLGYLFFELTGRRPGISMDAYRNEPTGDFLKFLQACLPHFGCQLSPKALRSHFRQVQPEFANFAVQAGRRL
jgi:hypothetical protein